MNLSDGHVRFTTPDAKSEESASKAGDVQWSDAVSHLPENLEDQPLEAVLIEIK